jgi:hypothetical protein
MRALIPLLLLVPLLGAPLAVTPAQADDKVAAKLEKAWFKAAADAGLSPELSDGQILFKRQVGPADLTWLILVDANDPTFFRVTIPTVWQIEDPLERLRVIEAANEASARIKVAKVYVVDDYAWVSVELLLDKPQRAGKHLDRVLTLATDALLAFAEAMNPDAEAE